MVIHAILVLLMTGACLFIVAYFTILYSIHQEQENPTSETMAFVYFSAVGYGIGLPIFCKTSAVISSHS